MNWDDLRIFLAVARAESLTAAAPGLRMDPATLSRRIARLEDALGAALFVKGPQGYALTERGQGLMAHAAEAEAALLRATESAEGKEALSGQIRIGAPDGCATFVLPQVCAAIQRAHPALELQILALPRVVNLSRREADMAVTVSPPEAGRVTVQKITDYRLHLAQRRDAPPLATLADLRGRPIVGYIPDMIFDRELDYLGEIGAGRVDLASNSVTVQLMMLRERGVGIVHDFALPSAPELVRVLTGALALRRAFHLVRHESDLRSARLSQVAALVAQGIRLEVARLEAAVARAEATARNP
ncbi:MAG: LysR family transcriptional regulator [Rubellimicrobium sp.]|nr:LysR family transcriptional regulator [Rubellimicrobium sp.]